MQVEYFQMDREDMDILAKKIMNIVLLDLLDEKKITQEFFLEYSSTRYPLVQRAKWFKNLFGKIFANKNEQDNLVFRMAEINFNNIKEVSYD